MAVKLESTLLGEGVRGRKLPFGLFASSLSKPSDVVYLFDNFAATSEQ